MKQMADDLHRIVSEAQVINQLFKARGVPVSVPKDPRSLPSHFLTPTTVVYDIEVPMSVDGEKLMRMQDDLLSYVRQFRRMNGIVTLDESGMESMPTVRVDRYEHTIEISRPHRDTLSWGDSNTLWQPSPNTAFCGLHYTHGGATPVMWDFSKPDQPHGLIAGATGSGKTNQLLSVLYSLMLNNNPASLQITLVDPKHSDGMQLLDDLPHIRAVGRKLSDAIHLIQKFHEEMGLREKGLVDKSVRHIIAIEECASLTEIPEKQLRDKIQFWLADIARRCREANMNLIVCTQKPTAEVLGDQLKSNLLMRLVGSVTSKEDANVAVQMKASGAEALPGYGSFIYRLNRTMLRFQVPLIDCPKMLERQILRRANGQAAIKVQLPKETTQAEVPGSDVTRIPPELVPVFQKYGNPDGTFKYRGLAEAMRALHGDNAPTGGEVYLNEKNRITKLLLEWSKTTSETTSSAKNATSAAKSSEKEERRSSGSPFLFRGLINAIKPQ